MNKYILALVLLVGCDGELAPGFGPPDSPEKIVPVHSAAFGSGSTDTGRYYRLHPVTNTGVCLDVGGKSTADNAGVLQFNCSSGENQRWYFRALSSTNYQLSAKHSAKCLRFENDSTGKAVVDQDPCGRVTSGT